MIKKDIRLISITDNGGITAKPNIQPQVPKFTSTPTSITPPIKTSTKNTGNFNFTQAMPVQSNKIVQTTDVGLTPSVPHTVNNALTGMPLRYDRSHDIISFAMDIGVGKIVTKPVVIKKPAEISYMVKFEVQVPGQYEYVNGSNFTGTTIRVISGKKISSSLIPAIRYKEDKLPEDKYGTKVAMVFLGWETIGGQRAENVTVTSDLVFIPKFKRLEVKRYDITLYGIDNKVFKVLHPISGESLKLLKDYSVSKDGYTFRCWLTKDNQKVEYSGTVKNNMELYPSLEKIKRNYDSSLEKQNIENFLESEKTERPKDPTSTYCADRLSSVKTIAEFQILDEITERTIIGLPQQSEDIIDITHLRLLTPIKSEDILFSVAGDKYIPDYFKLTNYSKRKVDGKDHYFTTRLIEDSQNIGTYYMEEYEYYLDSDMEDGCILDDNTLISRKDIKKLFASSRRLFQEGYYKYRGDLVPAGGYKTKDETVFRETMTTFLSDNDISFFDINKLYGADYYHRMAQYSSGLQKLITSTGGVIEEHRRISDNMLTIKDLEISFELEHKKTRGISNLFAGQLGESTEAYIQRQDRNVFQRLIDYKDFPTEKSFDNLLKKENEIIARLEYSNESENGENSISYYFDDSEIIFGFDSRPLHQYKIYLSDISTTLSQFFASYVVEGILREQKRQLFIEDWKKHYREKMISMIPRIYNGRNYNNINEKLRYTSFFGDTNSVNYNVFSDLSLTGEKSILSNIIKKDSFNTENNTIAIWGVR